MSWLDALFGGLARIRFNGSQLPAEGALNFTGAGVSAVTDNPSAGSTDVAIDGGAGPGATVPPFSTLFIVDGGSTVVVGNDGSVSAPWLTMTAGIAGVHDIAEASILVIPGSYPESTITVPATNNRLSITCLGAPNSTTGTINNGLAYLGSITTAGSLILQGISDAGNVTVGNQFTGRDCVLATFSAQEIMLYGCSVAAFSSTEGDIWSTSSFHGGNITSLGTLANFRNARFATAISVTFSGAAGVVDMDASSWQEVQDAGGLTIVNGSLRISEGRSVAWTPVLSSANSDATIGNGSMTASYRAAGDMLVIKLTIEQGGTTNYGTGNSRFSMPTGWKVAAPVDGETVIPTQICSAEGTISLVQPLGSNTGDAFVEFGINLSSLSFPGSVNVAFHYEVPAVFGP